MQKHVFKQHFQTSQSDRSEMKGHRPLAIWLTGLSGAGKSTIADALETFLIQKGIHTYILDGDNVRRGVCSDLGFSAEDRSENIRRIGELAALFVDAGIVVITSFISPFEKDRELAKKTIGEARFFELFVDAPIEVCEKRDPKGLYKKVRAGEIPNFTGISSPFEKPINPDLRIDTTVASVEEEVELIWEKIKEKLQ